MADEPTIRIVQGPNRWLLVRTDRDGASADEVAGMLAGFLQFLFRQLGADALEIFETGEHEWRIGQARPVKFINLPTKDTLFLSTGTKIADSIDLDVFPTVSGERPWFMVVEVWWRGVQTEVRWPALKVSGLGWREWSLDRADWLLLQSRIPAAVPADPGDATWGTAMKGKAKEAVKVVENWSLGLGAGLLAILGASLLLRRR
jgi:hypothetical protein